MQSVVLGTPVLGRAGALSQAGLHMGRHHPQVGSENASNKEKGNKREGVTPRVPIWHPQGAPEITGSDLYGGRGLEALSSSPGNKASMSENWVS